MSQKPASAAIAATTGSTSDLGPRGLVFYKAAGNTTFEYFNEAAWRELPSYPVEGQSGNLGSLTKLRVSLARLEGSVFVDLDALDLPATEGSQASAAQAPTNSGQVPPPPAGSVVLKELGKLYVVPPEASWGTAELEVAGDAGVLIERKAVVAPIPQNPFVEGTFCVLINVAALNSGT